MNELIQTKHDLCTGCNRCVRECPMEMANITYQNEDGSIKVKVDQEKCITCGRCFSVCKHNARYYEDDTSRFFDDLADGIPISLIAAPAIRTNIPDYKKLFTYLKQKGVNKIYDVSLGADICIWAHIRLMENMGNKEKSLITQPCPVIVNYCEIYRHDLLKNLSPVHSPMSCISIYMKKYEGITDRIAALSPCVAKANEFQDTNMAQYNVTFSKLLEYLEKNGIKLPEEETGFDHTESGIGSVFPMPGGLKENIEFFSGKKLVVDKADGNTVYEKLNTYAESPKELLPHIYDVLNCHGGCNIGSARARSANVFEINRAMDKSRDKATSNRNKEYFESVYKSYDDTLNISHFMREYRAIITPFPRITDEDIKKAFLLLGKPDDEKQHLDCGACGSDTCHNMARKIALDVNIPINCIVKSMEDAKKEHAEKLASREQLASMEKMLEADERMQVMLAANPQINILFSSDFRVIDCNPAAVEFMGFDTKEEMIAGFRERITKSIPAFQPNGRPSVPITERFISAAKEGSVKFETEINLNGVERSLNVEFKKIPYENSFAIVAYVFDLTEVQKRERELTRVRELNELQLAKLNLMVQATKIGLWDMEVVQDDPVNPANSFMWSDEFRSMIGFSDETDFPNVLSSWSDRLHPADKEKTLESFKRHLLDTTGETPYDVEYRLLKKSGKYAYFRASGETIRDENGKAVRVAGALIDITETKNILLNIERQRREAEAANRAKSAFLSTMSHEIRTPMNAILGITEILLQNEILAPNVKEALDKIYVSGDMLLGIINDILDLSKIEAGKMELMIDKYEIASMLSDTVQLNIMRIGSKPIEFELYVDENSPLLLSGDELRVKQILNNLLSNAFKYTAAGKVKLSVSTEPGGDNNDDGVTLVFSVIDTGPGMTKEQIDKLFDEYSRFNYEANRTTEGIGLGMSITRNLVRIMGGKISVESEPGKGSTFIVSLPQGKIDSGVVGKEFAENLRQFRTSSRAQMKRTQITREPMPYGSVIVVDDVETNIYVAKGLLAPYELKVDTADSGLAVIEKIKNGGVYDIIFMDHMMPNMDGIEAAKIIRSMGYEHPIVALTANAVIGQADIFLENGFEDFISKPIDVRQLNTVLNKFIRCKQPPKISEAQFSENAPRPTIDPRFAEIFARDAYKSIAALEAINKHHGSYDENDIRTYVIHVHGMRSALANIGKMELSAVAFKLEAAARNGNIDVMSSETGAFLDSLRTMVEELTPKIESENSETADEDRSYLCEKLMAIKAACEEYDEKTADEIITKLRAKTWSKPTQELLNTIARHLLHSDFEDVAGVVDKFMGNS